MQFDYAFGRYELFAGAMQFTVEASTDGGATWTVIWDAATDLTKADSGYYQSGTCRLSIPEEFCSSNVQFAFHYGKDWGSSAETVAVDNIRLEEEAACVHSHTEVRNEKEATCTEPGYTGDTYCADCGMLLEEGAEHLLWATISAGSWKPYPPPAQSAGTPGTSAAGAASPKTATW